MPEETRQTEQDAALQAPKPPKRKRAKGMQQQQSQEPDRRPGGAQQQGDSQRDPNATPDPMAGADGRAYTPPRTDEETAAPV